MKPRVTIIGLGQLGTSIGLSLKKTGAELEIIGHDKQRDAISAAQKLGAIDKGEWNLYNATEGAGLILLTMPLGGVLENMNLLKDDVAPGVIITDTASVKMPVIQAARAFKPGVHFIGGHPVFRPSLDGTVPSTEPSADLFQNAAYCLTPTPDTDPDAVQVLTGFVSMLGAKALYLDPAEHDGLTAGAQHLAVVLEAALLKTTTSSSGWRELNKFASDDFLVATRLAAQDASSNAQLLLAQREPLSSWIDQTTATLRDLKSVLAQNDVAALEKWLTTAQTARQQWLKNDVGTANQAVDMSEVRSGALRMFVGGLATRFGGDKKK
jgi:prephenate dehydrogenase